MLITVLPANFHVCGPAIGYNRLDVSLGSVIRTDAFILYYRTHHDLTLFFADFEVMQVHLIPVAH